MSEAINAADLRPCDLCGGRMVPTFFRSSLPDMWGLVSKHQTPRARLRIAAALIVAEMDRRDLLENRETRT